MPIKPETISAEALRATARRIDEDCEADHYHPLEAIAFFRRWPRSFARNFIYTLIFNALFAVAFTMIGMIGAESVSTSKVGRTLWNNLIISNAIGFLFWAVLSLMSPLLRRVNRLNFLQIVLVYTLIGTGIVTLAFLGLSQVPGFNQMQTWVLTPQQLLTSFILSFFISFVIGAIWRNRAQELVTQFALADERARTQAAERASAEANLRALQAQIEPHFLFNTLANVTGLIHTQPDQAKRMLEQFIDYLRVNLAGSREQSTTLAREFALMEKYLGIVQVRMGERLRVRFDLADGVRDFVLPPMLLQPLVENAIKHGLEPRIEGGEIMLAARTAGESVEITVADTGLGFAQTTAGDGMGLANVRERLQKIFGASASLGVEDNVPRGTRVVMRLPAQNPRPA